MGEPSINEIILAAIQRQETKIDRITEREADHERDATNRNLDIRNQITQCQRDITRIDEYLKTLAVSESEHRQTDQSKTKNSQSILGIIISIIALIAAIVQAFHK